MTSQFKITDENTQQNVSALQHCHLLNFFDQSVVSTSRIFCICHEQLKKRLLCQLGTDVIRQFGAVNRKPCSPILKLFMQQYNCSLPMKLNGKKLFLTHQ